MTERIDLGSTQAMLILEGKPSGSVRLADVQELDIIEVTHPGLQGEEPFFVAVFPTRVWVIPEDTVGVLPLMEELVPRLLDSRRIFQVRTSWIPWTWRRGRVLRRLPVPRLSHHPLRTLPSWERSPVDADELECFIGVGR